MSAWASPLCRSTPAEKYYGWKGKVFIYSVRDLCVYYICVYYRNMTTKKLDHRTSIQIRSFEKSVIVVSHTVSIKVSCLVFPSFVNYVPKLTSRYFRLCKPTEYWVCYPNLSPQLVITHSHGSTKVL